VVVEPTVVADEVSIKTRISVRLPICS